jgi:predicted nucleic acid-binding protein
MRRDTEPVLLDTSVWVEALRGSSQDLVGVTQGLLRDDRVLICGPVLFEINRGLRPSERKRVAALLDALVRLPVDESIWDAAGHLDASLRDRGITIPPMDVLIAQTCLHHNVILFTLGEHFRSIPGLKLFSPRPDGK